MVPLRKVPWSLPRYITTTDTRITKALTRLSEKSLIPEILELHAKLINATEKELHIFRISKHEMLKPMRFLHEGMRVVLAQAKSTDFSSKKSSGFIFSARALHEHSGSDLVSITCWTLLEDHKDNWGHGIESDENSTRTAS